MEKQLQNIPNQSGPTLNIVVAYDDVCSGIEAKDLCDQLARQLRPTCEVELSLWSLAALQFQDLAQMAADEAKQADLLIFAVNGTGWLRPSIKIWFSQRPQSSHPHLLMLVAQLRGILKKDQESPPTSENWKRLAAFAGVDILSQVLRPAFEQFSDISETVNNSVSLSKLILMKSFSHPVKSGKEQLGIFG